MELPHVPHDCQCNNHLLYILLADEQTRDALMLHLRQNAIHAVFHYIPLHLSTMGRSLTGSDIQLPVTESMSARLLRLPFYYGLTQEEQDIVISKINNFYKQIR